ncbi:MAG: hypothetical protein IT330_17935 [Anaerolineae bacterium]|nr:hypothetical protein [Anaerolineae bacterium]
MRQPQTKRTTPHSDLDIFQKLPWLLDASAWGLPLSAAGLDRDAFMLGGNGRLSARLGWQTPYCTLDRILGPYFDGYAFYASHYFRQDHVVLARDWQPPLDWQTTQHYLWRVRGTAIFVTQDSDGALELTTINAVLPGADPICLYRLFILRNVGQGPVLDFGLWVDALPEVMYPGPGHWSRIEPVGNGRLLETVTEYRLSTKPPYQGDLQRFRVAVRGLVGGQTRGLQALVKPLDRLDPGQTVEVAHYVIVAPDGVAASANSAANLFEQRLAEKGLSEPLKEARAWWLDWQRGGTQFTCSDVRVQDAVDAVMVLEKVCEHFTGGFTVIDDYTGCFFRDSEGPFLTMLNSGRFHEVRRGLDFFYQADYTAGKFTNSHLLDLPLLEPPSGYDWSQHHLDTPGDVPNLRVWFYPLYHAFTGDLEPARARFDYLKASLLNQDFAANGYLATWSGDETYGVGPIGPMRKGHSADNSFIAIAAARGLADLARRMGKEADATELEHLAEQIHQSVEANLWLEDESRYAMRLDKDGRLDRTASSPGLMEPLWIGAATDDDDHAARSLEYVLEHLRRPSGLVRTIPDYEYTFGHAVGMLLVGLARLDHPRAEEVFHDLLRHLPPSAVCGEYYTDDARGPVVAAKYISYTIYGHLARIWEAGVNIDALLFYLSGYGPHAAEGRAALKPHLPSGWREMAFRNLRLGDSCFDLEVARGRGQMRYRLRGHGPRTLNISLAAITKTGDASARLNGRAARPATVKPTRYGGQRWTFDLELGAGQTQTLQIREGA